MGTAVEQLTAYLDKPDPYDVPYADVRDLQLAALNERLQERVGRIKLLELRARDSGVTDISKLEDVVPLLLPHTAYKSYPESVLTEKRWDRLTKWLSTVSANPTDNVDVNGIADIDEWMIRLEDAGHYVGCSSGTTGKSAMLMGTKDDIGWVCKDSVTAFAWGSGVPPSPTRRFFGLAPVIATPRNKRIGDALCDAYCDPAKPRFDYPIPPITVGSITRMVALRKAIADGTALPGEIAEFEQTSAARQKAMDDSVGVCADALIEARGEPLFILGMWAALYNIALEVRNRGYSAKDFHPDNTSYVAGGLKGAQIPSNYREFVYETFNLQPKRNFQMYGMQEIGTSNPRCREAGRYHIPPWLVCVPLNKAGDEMLPITEGEMECRAAFFDLAVDGRWGGVISGDRIHVDFGPCSCGARSPSIRDDVIRYSDLEGDDKISCAGTVDAYVKGLS
jgi:hypothetical protein